MKYLFITLFIFFRLFVFSQSDPFGTIKLNIFIDSLETIEYIHDYTDIPSKTEQTIKYDLSKENIINKLDELGKKSFIHFPANDEIINTIIFYLRNKRKSVAVLSGLSDVYYPIYEEIFNRKGVPLDLKHLSAVESAFIPYIKSPVGARGLWQFMYGTGLNFNLKITDYIDERCDVYKSTEAAAKYLQYLHGLYNDWLVAISAYNCGPGNINKAITRAGGKNDYWSIRPYLPRETQEYIPRYITLSFLLTYAKDFGIEPMQSNFFMQKDTIHVKTPLSLFDVSNRLKIDFNNIRYLNSQFVAGIINPGNVLMLPIEKVSLFIEVFEKGQGRSPSIGSGQSKQSKKEKKVSSKSLKENKSTEEKKEEPKQEVDPFGTIKRIK